MITKIDSHQETVTFLEDLLRRLQSSSSLTEKVKVLDSLDVVKEAVSQYPCLKRLILDATPQESYALQCFIAIRQADLFFASLEGKEPSLTIIRDLISLLLELERSYDVIGGIIGYHLQVLKLIVQKSSQHPFQTENSRYLHPPGEDISKPLPSILKAIRLSIAAMEQMSEIYPVGGAGDRLDLHDETTKEALPSAELTFNGITLLEGLIRDLQAREYLHYKLHHKQVVTPIAMMTSYEKNNHQHIETICKKNHWFGRPLESMHLFVQPLVPVVAVDGDWVITSPGHFKLKPGGHGVIWKLAIKAGIIDKFLKQGVRYALVRQINNPLAATDFGLSAFIGWGIQHQKTFGFASCPRRLNASEGMDLLIETKVADGVDYRISNIEYTEFQQQGIKDIPAVAGSPYSQFPANTNILFVALDSLKELVKQSPIPGMLINMKTMVQRPGQEKEIPAGRLESTMQNISDAIVDHYPKPLKEIGNIDLSTYVTYNERKKTISVTKRSYTQGAPLMETPEGCFYEQLENLYQLFTEHCQFILPPMPLEEAYLDLGPSFIIYIHPALGPFYDIIGQKIQKGRLERNSELRLDLAEVKINQLTVNGSLRVLASSPLGTINTDHTIQYNDKGGKCTLNNVRVINQGIDRHVAPPNRYWKNQVARKESLNILIEGCGEFVASDVTFEGDLDIVVPDGHKMTVDMDQGVMRYRLEKIAAPTWSWEYHYDANDRICLNMTSS